MNKKSFLLLSAGLVMFAACNNEPKNEAPNQQQVDSMVNARVDKMQNDMTAKNDSIIAAQAKAKADSLEIVMKADSMAKAMTAAKTTTTRKTTTHKGNGTTTTTETTTETTKPGGLKGSSDQNSQSGGLKSHSDQSQQQQQQNKGGGGLKSHSDQNTGR